MSALGGGVGAGIFVIAGAAVAWGAAGEAVGALVRAGVAGTSVGGAGAGLQAANRQMSKSAGKRKGVLMRASSS